jgi:sugar-phosphatase
MIQVACSALLFDLDGVLIDSTHAGARVWTQWALAHGLDPAQVVPAAHGRPTLRTIREFLPEADAVAECREVNRREVEDLEGVVAWPGARELLRALPPARWTIVTSCSRPLAHARIRAAGLPLPRFLITADDVAHGKPAPEPYLKAAALLKAPAADCVVAEDVAVGVQAGKAAGARVLGFRTTISEAELKAAGADWMVDNCGAISLQPPLHDGGLMLWLHGRSFHPTPLSSRIP